MPGFIVTEKAIRPGGILDGCCYCHQKVGAEHKEDCVLIKRKAKVKMSVTYEIEVPAYQTKDDVEWHRNLGTWCASNAVEELRQLEDANKGCLCDCTEYEALELGTEIFLDEG